MGEIYFGIAMDTPQWNWPLEEISFLPIALARLVGGATSRRFWESASISFLDDEVQAVLDQLHHT